MSDPKQDARALLRQLAALCPELWCDGAGLRIRRPGQTSRLYYRDDGSGMQRDVGYFAYIARGAVPRMLDDLEAAEGECERLRQALSELARKVEAGMTPLQTQTAVRDARKALAPVATHEQPPGEQLAGLGGTDERQPPDACNAPADPAQDGPGPGSESDCEASTGEGEE